MPLTLFLLTPYNDDGGISELAVRVTSDQLTDLTETARIAFPPAHAEHAVTGIRVLSLLTGQRADVTIDEQILRPGRQLSWAVTFRALDWIR